MIRFLVLLSTLVFWISGAAAYPVTVRGGNESSFAPKAPAGIAIPDKGPYDVIVVGGGLSGLTATTYLTDLGKRVLLLEKEEALGGLAFGGIGAGGVPFSRGGAYWAAPYEEEEKIMDRIGLGNFETVNAIAEPIDSYFWKGELYLGIWEPDSLARLPASFALFKNELLWADRDKLIPNQPIEDENTELDAISAADWIRAMPKKAAARKDSESKLIFARFQKDKSLNANDPMIDVLDLLEEYGKSALGQGPAAISAAAFANFYISEIVTRYSSPYGNGHVSRLLDKILQDRPHLAHVKLRAAAIRIKDLGDKVEVEYVRNGRKYLAFAPHAILATQLWLAPKLIEGFAAKERERTKIINDIAYSHYAVHVVRVKGHPFRATYDTWFRPSDWSPLDFTDVVLGRWMDPAIRGYEGFRDYKTAPPDDQGIFTIYQPYIPKGESMKVAKETKTHLEQMARMAVDRLVKNFNPLLEKNWQTKIEVKSVETNLWPYSIHIVPPGYFKTKAKLLRKPFGRIYFANNNMGTPSFEEALFRGHCAANNVLSKEIKNFKQEAWTHCTLE